MKRSAFGLGIIACKLGKTLKDNPYPEEYWKHGEWIDGWNDCEHELHGNLKKHGIYEEGFKNA